MKISPEIKIKEFDVPDLVREDSVPMAVPAPAALGHRNGDYPIGPRDYKLSELSAADLETLCDNFTTAVFKKAGKSQPPRPKQARQKETPCRVEREREVGEPEECLPETK